LRKEGCLVGFRKPCAVSRSVDVAAHRERRAILALTAVYHRWKYRQTREKGKTGTDLRNAKYPALTNRDAV